ncbi:hypothetical protein COTS27_00535 [Spirochaetota bacterium]|nr:hypothetical protein COTS27_00535 [Spirochaetota bacterium]
MKPIKTNMPLIKCILAIISFNLLLASQLLHPQQPPSEPNTQTTSQPNTIDTNNTPEDTNSPPEDTNNTPEDTNNTLEDTNNTLEDTNNTSEDTNNTPEDTNNIPEDTSNTSEDTSNTPESIDNTPTSQDSPPSKQSPNTETTPNAVNPPPTPNNTNEKQAQQKKQKFEQLPLETFTNSKGEVFDLSTFTNYGVYFLEDITLSKLIEPEAAAAESSPLAEFNFKQLVIELINDKNETIIRKLATEIDPEYETNQDLDFLQTQVLKLLTPKPEPEDTTQKLQEVKLFSELPIKGLVLKTADIVDVYDNRIGNVSERMVDLYGGVNVIINDSEIKADFIRINVTRRESFAEGNVLIKIGEQILTSEKILWDIDNRYGYVFNARGEINRDYYEGKLVRINSSTHFTIEQGWLTFSKNLDPYYKLSSAKFDVYDTEKWIVQNALIIVGDHPFLWIPYYINFPLSARLELKFGESRREGYYALTKFSFPVPYINSLLFNFNIYEKLGLYASIENRAEFGQLKYDFLLAGALYTFNENTRTIPRLAYTYHTGQYLESKSRIRHKVAYNQILSLTPTTNKLVRSSIDFSVTNVSDPFITDNFKRNLSHIDWQKIIERHDRDESLYNPRISDKDAYSIKYTLSAPSLAIGAKFDWIYDVYDDPALHERPVDERYHMYLKTFSLPNLNISHSGTLDPVNTDATRLFYLNLGYKLGFSYNGTANYKDGERQGQGLDINTNIEPYGLIKENYNLAMDLSFNRPFSINQGSSSIVNLDSDWFSWNLTPDFILKYKRNWVGKDYSDSNDEEEDRTDITMNYGFQTAFNFNTQVVSFLDHTASLSFKVNNTNTTFRLPRGEFFTGTDTSTRRNKEFNYLLSSAFKFNFPSAKQISLWDASYDYRSMLPTLTTQLSYAELAFTSDEKIDNKQNYSFDQYSYRRLSYSLGFTQKGYGLFYIPKFDYVLKNTYALSYDFNTVTNNIEPQQSKFESFNGSLALDFIYDYYRSNLITYKNKFSYQFFDVNRQEIVPEILSYTMSFNIGFKRKQPSRFYVDIENVSFGFNWNYYFREQDYLKDSMGFSFAFGFSIVNRYKINFQLESANPSSYLYFNNKASTLSSPQVNFFRDIGNSLGFYGVNGLIEGLFKLKAFSVSLEHDIGDWFASFSYTFIPIEYSDDSLRGFYLEHRVAFEVNLKPERDPRGASTARSSPFFDDIEESRGTDVFKNVIRN